MRTDLHERIRRTASAIAEGAGASAEVAIDQGNPITWNDPGLAHRVRPTLERVAGAENVVEPLPWTGAEDFARYQERVPGVFLFLGIVAPGVDPKDAAPNHSSRFVVDEATLGLGVRALAQLAVDTLSGAIALEPKPDAARDPHTAPNTR